MVEETILGKSGGLRPLDMVNQPAMYTERYKMVKKLFSILKKVNPNTKQALEGLSVQLESLVAKLSRSGQSYRFNMSVLIRDLLKFKGDLLDIKIAGKLLYGEIDEKFLPKSKVVKEVINITKDEALKLLNSVLVPSEVLVKNNYIMDIYSDKKEFNVTGYIPCSRCNTKFQKKDIMRKTICKYHPLKKQRSDKDREEIYPCCGKSSSSTCELRLGCKTSDNHVFRYTNYNELSTITEFNHTKYVDGEKNVLALDCEMAFTSLGYEMIRLTIVDFFTSQILFDEIVQPIGDIIDLNTQFSGVHEIDRSKHLTYNEVISKVIIKELINKNSILIGHGLENDLNVLRIIHDNIIDTAILYSKGRYKTSLKNLSFEVLNRTIQTGEHDSSEDAIAAMDVLKKKLGIPIVKKNWERS
ncbi:hypothetical protein TPHA_0C00990 [Tetrapisispora phaffii CBS 4417]|uniref:RNA exonuclease 3 n=1 Tax=Tetrapisispora phaffii (strain ATCC 24235 / CBS 4417 / NBRC 1672 / NRRL Y-8282 / UCD 70-5) TaxID=1071381 RepID=G8BR79_TETPH|nr:hypothetical protein TPHA_0C00990 [Tetrapisispora phaffii CBS 4417]CCE62255.1 hypothetical protein TPHA_0C00990 [Tetrapisispora phaffii CBS 4417]